MQVLALPGGRIFGAKTFRYHRCYGQGLLSPLECLESFIFRRCEAPTLGAYPALDIHAEAPAEVRVDAQASDGDALEYTAPICLLGTNGRARGRDLVLATRRVLTLASCLSTPETFSTALVASGATRHSGISLAKRWWRTQRCASPKRDLSPLASYEVISKEAPSGLRKSYDRVRPSLLSVLRRRPEPCRLSAALLGHTSTAPRSSAESRGTKIWAHTVAEILHALSRRPHRSSFLLAKVNKLWEARRN